MKKILLDTNAYDALKASPRTVARVCAMCARGQLKIIAISTIRDELIASPFGGIPSWFPVALELDAIGAISYSKIGHACIGRDDVYSRHRGGSHQVKDAIVAESAVRYADILVSDDGRCRSRLVQISNECMVMSCAKFIEWVETTANSQGEV